MLKLNHRLTTKAQDELERETGTIIVEGELASIRVESTQLVITNGTLKNEEPHDVRVYQKGNHQLRLIILITSSGYVTLDALAWMKEQSVQFVHCNLYNCEIGVYTGLDHRNSWDACLHSEKQLELSSSEKAVEIARYIVDAKISTQMVGLQRLNIKVPRGKTFMKMLNELHQASDINAIRLIEARASSLYWTVLSKHPVRWERATGIPENWRVIGERGSPLGNGNGQHAVSPFHSLYNYAIGVVITRLYFYCIAYRLNPAIGTLHTGKPGRLSLLWDLVEELRPVIESSMILHNREIPYKKGMFHVLSTGELFVYPEKVHEILNDVLPNDSSIKAVVARYRALLLKSE